MGKTLTAQNVALRLWYEKEYNIVPYSNLNDIQMLYRDNGNQVFFIDDICDDKLICERLQLESKQRAHEEFTIIIPSDDKQKYKDRLRMDLVNGKIHWCLNNMQMNYKEYRDKFLDIVKYLDSDMKRRCIYIKDENVVNSFIISCKRGYDELIDLFICVGADVNAQNGWFTPLTAACREGHLRTVEIDKGSDINKTNKKCDTKNLYCVF
ncbi:Hypothetical predicted protein [Mytilus galloprovincialis]|uniref:Novel STAND NTPase 3 domain-containing protein n=1 Tax=Mytilus galloprovincialis TaxID=29158 RepID=A0A8B6C709_MYTGA|nr:Hypothetical predicted protein [Mytilus galloprovincialis]